MPDIETAHVDEVEISVGDKLLFDSQSKADPIRSWHAEEFADTEQKVISIRKRLEEGVPHFFLKNTETGRVNHLSQGPFSRLSFVVVDKSAKKKKQKA